MRNQTFNCTKYIQKNKNDYTMTDTTNTIEETHKNKLNNILIILKIFPNYDRIRKKVCNHIKSTQAIKLDLMLPKLHTSTYGKPKRSASFRIFGSCAETQRIQSL